MKVITVLLWIAVSLPVAVRADPVVTDFCMFPAGKNSRLNEHGFRFPVPQLISFAAELTDTSNPVFSEAFIRQWHLDKDFALVKEDGSAHLLDPQQSFATDSDGTVWTAYAGRLHRRRASEEVFHVAGFMGDSVKLPDAARVVWSNAYNAVLVTGEQGLYIVQGERLESLPVSGAAMGRILFLRDLPLFNSLAIGDHNNQFFLLDAQGRLQHVDGFDSDERDWWFSSVDELQERNAIVVRASHENFLLLMHPRSGGYDAEQAQRLPRILQPGPSALPDMGHYYPSISRFLAYGYVDDWWPFTHRALHQLSGREWQAIPGSDISALGERPFLREIRSRKILLIRGKDRLFTYTPGSGLQPLPNSENSNIGRHAWAIELAEMDKVIVRSERGLYELTKDLRLLTITSVEALGSKRINEVVALPGANAAVVLTDRSVFGLTASNELIPINSVLSPEMFEFGLSAQGIAGRSAAFFQARNGHFLVTTEASGHCPRG